MERQSRGEIRRRERGRARGKEEERDRRGRKKMWKENFSMEYRRSKKTRHRNMGIYKRI